MKKGESALVNNSKHEENERRALKRRKESLCAIQNNENLHSKKSKCSPQKRQKGAFVM